MFMRFVFGFRLFLVILVLIIWYCLDVYVFEEFKFDFIEFLKNFFYVDDFVIGEDSVVDVLEFCEKFELIM